MWKKGKSKAKVIGEEEDGEEEEQAKKDKISAELAMEHACAVSGHKVCWVCNDGQHICLQPKDLSTWAL